MTDIVGKVMSIIAFAVIFIMIITMYLGRAEYSKEAYIRNEATMFIDECRTTGRISPANYETFMKQVATLGSYNVDMAHGKKMAYASGYFNSDDTEIINKGKYEQDYLYTGIDGILEGMFSEDGESSDYNMRTGDTIEITITHNAGMFYRLMQWIAGANLTNDGVLIRYGGTVGNTP